MEKPDLNKMWRTWVKLGLRSKLTHKILQDTIRHEMYGISQLQKTGEVTWYYFLIHDKLNDPDNVYFDVKFTTDRDSPEKFLPKYCTDTEKIAPITEISGIDKTILKDDNIEEAWRIIGEQSEFLIDLVRAHKDDREINHQQIGQFMHYFMNAMGLGGISVLFFPQIPHPIKVQIQLMPEEVRKNYVPF